MSQRFPRQLTIHSVRHMRCPMTVTVKHVRLGRCYSCLRGHNPDVHGCLRRRPPCLLDHPTGCARRWLSKDTCSASTSSLKPCAIKCDAYRPNCTSEIARDMYSDHDVIWTDVSENMSHVAWNMVMSPGMSRRTSHFHPLLCFTHCFSKYCVEICMLQKFCSHIFTKFVCTHTW